MCPRKTFYVYSRSQNINLNLAVLKYLVSAIKVVDLNEKSPIPLRVLWHAVVGCALGVSDKVLLVGWLQCGLCEERLELPCAVSSRQLCNRPTAGHS